MSPRSALASVAIVLSLLLAACGNKGPLVLPEPAPAETAPTEPGQVPVTIDPQDTMPQPDTEGALRDPTSADPLLVDPVTGPPPAGDSPDDPEDDGGQPPADDVDDDGGEPAGDDGTPPSGDGH